MHHTQLLRRSATSSKLSLLAEHQNLLVSLSHSITKAKTAYYHDKGSNNTDIRHLFSTSSIHLSLQMTSPASLIIRVLPSAPISVLQRATLAHIILIILCAYLRLTYLSLLSLCIQSPNLQSATILTSEALLPSCVYLLVSSWLSWRLSSHSFPSPLSSIPYFLDNYSHALQQS